MGANCAHFFTNRGGNDGGDNDDILRPLVHIPCTMKNKWQ